MGRILTSRSTERYTFPAQENNVGCVYVWMCVGFHIILVLDLLVANALRLIWACLKDKHYMLEIQYGKFQEQTRIRCPNTARFIVLPHISLSFCMSASLYVLLKTSFPCFPVFMISRALGFISLSLSLTKLGLESLSLNSKFPMENIHWSILLKVSSIIQAIFLKL